MLIIELSKPKVRDDIFLAIILLLGPIGGFSISLPLLNTLSPLKPLCRSALIFPFLKAIKINNIVTFASKLSYFSLSNLISAKDILLNKHFLLSLLWRVLLKTNEDKNSQEFLTRWKSPLICLWFVFSVECRVLKTPFWIRLVQRALRALFLLLAFLEINIYSSKNSERNIFISPDSVLCGSFKP